METRTPAYVVPFVTFMGFILLFDLLAPLGLRLDNIDQAWYRRRPEYLMMGLQMAVCFPMLWHWRKRYERGSFRVWWLGLVLGIVGITVWILPTHLYTLWGLDYSQGEGPFYYEWFGVVPRDQGFDAAIFQQQPAAYWTTILLRFIRAVVLVPIIEEVFWRGFLMRYVLRPNGDYWKVPFGQASLKSYLTVTLLFMLVHGSYDWFGAFVFGSLMYFVATQSKSLSVCIFMHGVANLVLGWYALSYSKYGLW